MRSLRCGITPAVMSRTRPHSRGRLWQLAARTISRRGGRAPDVVQSVANRVTEEVQAHGLKINDITGEATDVRVTARVTQVAWEDHEICAELRSAVNGGVLVADEAEPRVETSDLDDRSRDEQRGHTRRTETPGESCVTE
jgi:hypothetical protein